MRRSKMTRYVILIILIHLLSLNMAEPQTTSGGVVWGPVIKLSRDDPNPSGGSYTPKLSNQGDTIHCVWFGGSYGLPYRRSTDDGLTWEETRELITDSTNYASGIYLYQMRINTGYNEVKKKVLIK